MRRRYAGHLRRRQVVEPVDLHPLSVHRDEYNVRAGCSQSAPVPGVVRLLKNDGSPNQQTQAQVDGLLEAVRNDYLVRPTFQPAGARQVAGKCFTGRWCLLPNLPVHRPDLNCNASCTTQSLSPSQPAPDSDTLRHIHSTRSLSSPDLFKSSLAVDSDK